DQLAALVAERHVPRLHPRGGSVAVRFEADPAAGRVWVAVRDTGIGLDPAVLPHVFEPFVQARQNLDRGRGGVGLGLATVEGLVRLHGGGSGPPATAPAGGASSGSACPPPRPRPT